MQLQNSLIILQAYTTKRVFTNIFCSHEDNYHDHTVYYFSFSWLFRSMNPIIMFWVNSSKSVLP